jgi:hypothetical protein
MTGFIVGLYDAAGWLFTKFIGKKSALLMPFNQPSSIVATSATCSFTATRTSYSGDEGKRCYSLHLYRNNLLI